MTLMQGVLHSEWRHCCTGPCDTAGVCVRTEAEEEDADTGEERLQGSEIFVQAERDRDSNHNHHEVHGVVSALMQIRRRCDIAATVWISTISLSRFKRR